MLHSAKTKKKIFGRPKKNHPIALLTDFGIEDQYVAVMKGVILSVNPEARIIDITHSVEPHEVREGGYLLWSAYRYLPNETMVLGIVDPGVGSSRKILCIKTARQYFLAPDNGLLDFILAEEPNAEAMSVDIERSEMYLRSAVSATFHGRDVFAPLAAFLSLGIDMKEFGTAVKLPAAAPLFIGSQENKDLKPCILHVDHFGNIITNIRMLNVPAGEAKIKALNVGRSLVSRWVRTYVDAPDNTPCMIVGSSGLVEVSMKNQRASSKLNADLRTQVKIYWR